MAAVDAFVDSVTAPPLGSGVDALATRQPELKEAKREMLKRHFQLHMQVIGSIEFSLL
jgi:hypothetical protein